MILKEPIVQCLGFDNEDYLIKISFVSCEENYRRGVILKIKPEDCPVTSLESQLIHTRIKSMHEG